MESESKPNYPDDEHNHESHDPVCASMPDFTRMRYFHGQMLVAHDLQTEQDYFREKLKLINRCLHGYGTVCGLYVTHIEDAPECEPWEHHEHRHHGAEPYEQTGQEEPKHKPHPTACVEIECGLALDCEGNELVVRQPLRVDVWHSLTDTERHELHEQIESGKQARVYLSICYCVQPLDPVRPVIPDACNAVSECVYSRLRDTVKVRVSRHRPEVDHCRDNCCHKCKDKCLLLAMIIFEKGKNIFVRNDVRRWITVYEPVTITGVNWVHGATNYTPAEARKILQADGVTVEFSRPILTETVTKGVVDVLVFSGGRGQHGGIHFIDGELSCPDPRHIVFKDMTGESLQNADRVLVIVRTDFILDQCCRPVDGNHTGGRVRLLPTFSENEPKAGMPKPPTECKVPPHRYGRWTSGNGNPGGTFESWFYIEPEVYQAPAGYQQRPDKFAVEDDE